MEGQPQHYNKYLVALEIVYLDKLSILEIEYFEELGILWEHIFDGFYILEIWGFWWFVYFWMFKGFCIFQNRTNWRILYFGQVEKFKIWILWKIELFDSWHIDMAYLESYYCYNISSFITMILIMLILFSYRLSEVVANERGKIKHMNRKTLLQKWKFTK